jgi:hypothetical protein
MSLSRVLRADDPERKALESAGWRVTALSWGAQLDAVGVDPGALRSFIDRVEGSAHVRPLRTTDLDAMLALDATTVGDYPGGIATQHEALERDQVQLGDLRRCFGALDLAGHLLAMTLIVIEGESAETQFTVVAADARGRGLATAVKAASILGLMAEGVTRFRTGGSNENSAIIAANQRLGYVRDEEWITLRSPNDSG